MRRAISIICAIALCACERDHADQTVEMPVPKVTVHMVDPGAEPRSPIRMHADAGAHATFTATVTGEFDQPRRAPMPSQSFTFETTAAAVSRDGVIHLRQRILSGSDDKAIGRVYETWMDARGVRTRPGLATIRPGDKIPHDGEEPELSLITPEEAVGVGARWHEDIAVGAATSSVDVELMARDGDRVRERITFHSEGPILGSPARRDGTVIEEFAVTDPDGSMHRIETFAIDFPQGHAHGSRTTDVVRDP